LEEITEIGSFDCAPARAAKYGVGKTGASLQDDTHCMAIQLSRRCLVFDLVVLALGQVKERKIGIGASPQRKKVLIRTSGCGIVSG